MYLHFLHTFQPDPIFFQIGFLKIHWYGLIIGLSALTALYLAIKINEAYKKNGLAIFKNKDQIIDLCFYMVLLMLLGARTYEVLLFLPYYIENPLSVFKIWEGGLAIHGGIIAGVMTIFYYVKKHNINPGLAFDIIAPVAILAQAVGRWGNYFNQELFGKPTNLSWGIPIDPINRPATYENFQYFHPTFVYESILNLTLAIILLLIHKNRLKKLPLTNKQKGDIFLYYLIGYSVIRFLLEYIKIDETPLFFGIRWPQVISIIIALISLGILFYKKSGSQEKTT